MDRMDASQQQRKRVRAGSDDAVQAADFRSAADGTTSASALGLSMQEQLLRQTELLRRLDADAHEVERAELQGQVAQLCGDVDALRGALQQALARGAIASASSASSGACAASDAPSVSELESELRGSRGEAAGLRADNDALKRRLDHAFATAAERDAAHARAIARLEGDVATLDAALAAAAAARAAAEAAVGRLAISASASSSSSSAGVGGPPGGGGGQPLSASVEREMMGLREQLRAAQRAQRAAATELASVGGALRNEELLRTQIDALERKVQRLEAGAGASVAARGVISLLVRALGRYESAVGRALSVAQQSGTDTDAVIRGESPSSAAGREDPQRRGSIGRGAASQARPSSSSLASSSSFATPSHQTGVGKGQAAAPLASSSITPELVEALLLPHAQAPGSPAPDPGAPAPSAPRPLLSDALGSCASQAEALLSATAQWAANSGALAQGVLALRGKLAAAAEARATAQAASSSARAEALRAAAVTAEHEARRGAAERALAVATANSASLESLLKTYDAEDRAFAPQGAVGGSRGGGAAAAAAAAVSASSAGAAARRPPRGASAPATALYARVVVLEKSLAELNGVNASLVAELGQLQGPLQGLQGHGQGLWQPVSLPLCDGAPPHGAPSPSATTSPSAVVTRVLSSGLISILTARIGTLGAELSAARAESAALYEHTPIVAATVAEGGGVRARGEGSGAGGESSSSGGGLGGEGSSASSSSSAGGGALVRPLAFDPSLAALDAAAEEREEAAPQPSSSSSFGNTRLESLSSAGGGALLLSDGPPAAPRVLHLTLNPTSAALMRHDAALSGVVAALRVENASLRELLERSGRALAAAAAASGGLLGGEGGGAPTYPGGGEVGDSSLHQGGTSAPGSPPSSSSSSSSSASMAMAASVRPTGEQPALEGRARALSAQGLALLSSSLLGGGPGGGGLDVTSSSSSSSSSSVDTDKLRQRMKDVFREGIVRLREAVYRLTGFKVDMMPGGSGGGGAGGAGGPGGAGSDVNIVLRSVFADSPTDYLEFKMAGETLEMLETEWTNRLDKKLFAYLTVSKSIPAFLAALTLEAFERQTLASTMG